MRHPGFEVCVLFEAGGGGMARKFVSCRDSEEDVAGVVAGCAVGADLGEADGAALDEAG